jgi:hypothetical protein
MSKIGQQGIHMRTKIKSIIITTMLAAMLATPAWAKQGNPESAGVQQEAKTLKDNNMILSRKIAYMYRVLGSYIELYNYYKPKNKDEKGGANEHWRKLKLTPRQTILHWLRKDNKPEGEVIGFKMIQYDFVYPTGKRGITAPQGSRTKSIALYFEGDKLSKIVSELEDVDFKQNTRTMDIVVDEDPHTDPETLKYVSHKEGEKVEKIDDIKFKHIYTNRSSYEKIVADMKLEISNPHRIMFKRDFYIKHLKHFENLFRLTDDYQRSTRQDRDKYVVEDLKESLDY